MVELPEELLVEILSRLSVKSLVRFKCVCKFWYSLLQKPKFVSRHIAKQSKDHVILMHNANGNIMSILSNNANYDDDDDDDDVSCIVDLDMDLKCPSHEDGCTLYMHGYCDGIVVLSDFEKEIILFNPALREVRSLPKSDTFLPYISEHNPHDSETSSIGFGYDPKSEDYKVIRVMAFWADEDHNCRLSDRAEVFSLRADSTWREVKGAVGAQLSFSDDLEHYFDGVHYWTGKDENTQNSVVLSFDLAEEVFQKTPIPDVYDDKENRLRLGVLKNESIALFVFPRHGSEKFIDVWVMKEFGVKESWIKQSTIGPLLEFERPLVFWKNDKELLQENRSGQLVSYDLATLDFKKLNIHHKFCPFMSWRAYLYIETLVNPNMRDAKIN